MTKVKAVIVLLLLVAGFIAFRTMQQERAPETHSPLAPGSNQTQRAPSPAETEEEQPQPASVVTADAPDCLSLRQLEENLMSGPDAERLITVSVGGPDFDAYRGLDDVSLRSYVEQGDAAAMAVVGANAVMRAYGRDESQALQWLNFSDTIQDLHTLEQTLTPEASLELNDAAYWFYQSAMQGRVFALRNYGLVRSRLFGGPVGLGWIGQEEFESLSDEEKLAYEPQIVYQQAVYNIAPELGEGALGSLLRRTTESAPDTDTLAEIRDEIAREFSRTLAESDLPPLRIPPTASPVAADVRAHVCASEPEDAKIGL